MKKQTSPQQPDRSGFTLIELLAVITIIAILLALILPAISGVMRNARNAEAATELTKIDQALTTFREKFGEYPPSFLSIPAAGGTWNASSRAAIKSIWPQFNFATNGGLGNSTAFNLSGAECLVFFLGGIQNGNISAPGVYGFSTNPLSPWTQSGNPDGPFLEFDFGRLTDVDGDGLFEYVDTLAGQTTPILYLSGGGGNMNRDNDNELRVLPPHNDTLVQGNDDYDVFDPTGANSSKNMKACYLQPDGDADFTNNIPYKKDSFQLISPGEDGEYGTGGVYSEGEDLSGNRRIEADNITNFSGGTLQ